MCTSLQMFAALDSSCLWNLAGSGQTANHMLGGNVALFKMQGFLIALPNLSEKRQGALHDC